MHFYFYCNDIIIRYLYDSYVINRMSIYGGTVIPDFFKFYKTIKKHKQKPRKYGISAKSGLNFY